MKILPVVIAVTALGVGSVGATTAYVLTAPEPTGAVQVTSPAPLTTSTPAAESKKRPRAAWAPCPEGTVLEGKICVKTLTRQVTRMVQPSAPTSPVVATPTTPPTAPQPTQPAVSGQGHETEHGDGHETEHEQEHGDDHDVREPEHSGEHEADHEQEHGDEHETEHGDDDHEEAD